MQCSIAKPQKWVSMESLSEGLCGGFYPAERVECQVSDKVVVSKVRRISDRIRRCRLLCMTCGTADHESVHFDAEPGSY